MEMLPWEIHSIYPTHSIYSISLIQFQRLRLEYTSNTLNRIEISVMVMVIDMNMVIDIVMEGLGIRELGVPRNRVVL